eukprot:g20739.t1
MVPIFILFAIGDGGGQCWLFHLLALTGGVLVAGTGGNAKAILLNTVPVKSRGSLFGVYTIMDDLGKGLGPALVASWVRALGRRVSFMIGRLGVFRRGTVKGWAFRMSQLVSASAAPVGPTRGVAPRISFWLPCGLFCWKMIRTVRLDDKAEIGSPASASTRTGDSSAREDIGSTTSRGSDCRWPGACVGSRKSLPFGPVIQTDTGGDVRPRTGKMQMLLVAIGIGALVLGGGAKRRPSGNGQQLARLPCCCYLLNLRDSRNGIVNFNQVYDGLKTGKVVNHTWEVKWRNCPNNGFNQPCGTSDMAPGPIFHGVRSKAITINDQTPGPEVVADLGDLIRVEVKNVTWTSGGGDFLRWGRVVTLDLNEPITVHFHGITQFSTPYMDGTPLSNCAIPPGGARVADGKLVLNQIGGCLTFANPDFVGGFNPAVFAWENKSTFGAVMGDALLFESVVVNGKGVYDYESTQLTVKTHGLSAKAQFCPGQKDPPDCYTPGVGSTKCDTSSATSLCGEPEVFEVEEGNSSIIHLVSDAQLYMLQVCIDGHDMVVLGSDMMPVEPFETKCLIMGPGERYDISVKCNQEWEPGDYKIRFTTLEYGAYLESQPWHLPHQGFALLRYKGSALGLPKNPDGPNYWLSAKTLGCSSTPSAEDPNRCHSPRALLGIPETLRGYYGDGDFTPPHELEAGTAKGFIWCYFVLRWWFLAGSYQREQLKWPSVAIKVRFSAQVSFLPDEVPRTENKALLSRMQIYPEERGFPFMWTDEASGWKNETWQVKKDSARNREMLRHDTPTAFLFPDQPTLSLPSGEREAIYTRRHVWRVPNTSHPAELYPHYPNGWSQIQSGAQTVTVEYGDVVRVFMNATIPFGAGAAMPHPMHLHGHKVAVMAMGKWDEPYDESKLSKNPIYKDIGQQHKRCKGDSWMVIQFVTANPGVWMFHCHVNIHVNSGMGMAIDVGGELPNARRTPEGANMSRPECPRSPGNRRRCVFHKGLTHCATSSGDLWSRCLCICWGSGDGRTSRRCRRGAGEAAPEKTDFDLILKEVPKEKKIAVIKAIRSITGLGLKEAKGLADNPGKIIEGKPKEACEDAKKQLEEAGAKAEIESKQLCGACRKVPVDPEITVKVVNGEVTGLVYEWDLQDSWPIHFTKARLQILSFAELEILEVSRRGVSEWHSGAVAETVLPPGFEIEELGVTPSRSDEEESKATLQTGSPAPVATNGRTNGAVAAAVPSTEAAGTQ